MNWTTPTETGLRNVHRRHYSDINGAWRLAQRVSEPDAGVWPTDGWDPMLLDGGLAVGSTGGHGAVRYVVSATEPSSFRFNFTMRELTGFHEFRRENDELVHELILDRPSPLVRYALIPLHDAVIEELFDNVEDQLAGRRVPRKRRRTVRVRLLRRVIPD